METNFTQEDIDKLISKLKDKYNYTIDWGCRDAQTDNMQGLMSLLLNELRSNKQVINDKMFFPNFMRLFFGGITVAYKIKYIHDFKLNKNSENKLIDFIEKAKKATLELISDDEEDKYLFGLTGTIPLAAQWYRSNQRKEVTSFIKMLIDKESFSNIQKKVIAISDNKFRKFTPGVISNALFAYNPKIYPILNKPVVDGLIKFSPKLKFDSKNVHDYFRSIPVFKAIKDNFNLRDYGQVDSLITGWAIERAKEPKKASNNDYTAKNTIFFGPPGTGKTFITKEKAVNIILEQNG